MLRGAPRSMQAALKRSSRGSLPHRRGLEIRSVPDSYGPSFEPTVTSPYTWSIKATDTIGASCCSGTAEVSQTGNPTVAIGLDQNSLYFPSHQRSTAPPRYDKPQWSSTEAFNPPFFPVSQMFAVAYQTHLRRFYGVTAAIRLKTARTPPESSLSSREANARPLLLSGRL